MPTNTRVYYVVRTLCKNHKGELHPCIAYSTELLFPGKYSWTTYHGWHEEGYKFVTLLQAKEITKHPWLLGSGYNGDPISYHKITVQTTIEEELVETREMLKA